MTLLEGVRLGAQTPRVLVLPQGAVSSSGAEAAEFGELAGLVLDPWQRSVVDVGLGERADRTWAAKTVDLFASRQNGKNLVVEVRELFGAVILGERITHTAHLFTTAMKSYKRLVKMTKAHPDIDAEVVKILGSPASGYSLEFKSGGVVEYIARSSGGGRGFTADVLVFDEAQDLSDDALGALLPTLSATSVQGDPQIWYLGSAPDLTSVVWQRRRAKGRAGGSPTSAYFEFSADPASDLDDRDAWAQANPGLNIHISEEYIQSVERSGMSDEEFARERLSISPELVDENDLLLEHWPHVNHPTVAPGKVAWFGLDCTPERSHGSIAVVDYHRNLELIEAGRGVDWLAARAKQLVEAHEGAGVVVDGRGPAAAIGVELQQAGVPVQFLDTKDVGRGSTAFFDSVVSHRLQVRSDRRLDAAVKAAVRRSDGESWRFTRRTKEDISPLMAVVLAHWAVAVSDGETVYQQRGMTVLG